MSEQARTAPVRPATAVRLWLRVALLCAIGLLVVTLSSVRRGHSPQHFSQHITQAELWQSPDTRWSPPQTLTADEYGAPAHSGAWTPVSLPHTRERAIASQQSPDQPHVPTVVWYRMALPASALVDTGQGVRLYVPRWQTIGTVGIYLDGQLVWQTRGSQVWNSFNYPVWLDLGNPHGALAREGAVLHVRMASEPSVGGALSSIWVGPADELRDSWRLRSFFQTGLIAISQGSYVVLGIFAFCFWLRRAQRGETVYLLFFLMAVSHLFAALQFLVDNEGITLPDDWFSWMTQVGLLGTSVCSFFFLCIVQRQRRPCMALVLVAYTALVIVASLPVWGVRHDTILPLMRMALLPNEVLVLLVALRGALRHRDAASLCIAAWIALSFPVGFHDLALQSYRISIENIYLTPYVYLGLFTLFMVIAFTRYTGALDAAEHANAHLGERLNEQQEQLAQTHARLLAAEREQTLLQERQRLMREMHDGVGSSLMTALRLVERGDTEKLNLAQVLKECIDDLKISIDSLEPLDHDLLALLAALRFRLEPRLEGAGLALDWSGVRDLPALPWLDAQNALHVLRIFQEVLTNIIKHSGAHHLRVSTMEAPRGGLAGVQVQIIDDGRRFEPPDQLPAGRKGLANIRTRALVLQGQVTWEALAAGGNCFTLWLPLSRVVHQSE